MISRSFARVLLGASAIALAALPAPAAAQRVERIVAFGDSYADIGNVFKLTGTSSNFYPTGRFSGGTNYIDTLSQLLGVQQDNFAIGGALTNNNNTAGVPLGFVTEYTSFLAGGGPAAFPRVSGKFGPNDLLAISIGGNDARVYQQQGGTVAGAGASAATAVANTTTGLNALVGAGARNISFLAGNTSTLPEIATNPSAQAVRNAYSTAFNTGIQQTLAGYAANGVIVNYTDLSIIGARIAADPTRFGLTSAGACPVAQATQCVTNQSFANQFLFYVDALHLTSAGFAIVGQYIYRQTQAPLNMQAASDIGLDTARQFGRTLSSRVDLGSPRDGEVAEGLRVFAVGDGFTRKIGRSDTNDAFNIEGSGGTVGIEFGSGNLVAGVAGNYTRPRADFGNDSARVRGHSMQIGGFAGYALGPVFVQGQLGYGQDRHRITRTGVIDNLSARPDGSHVLAGAKAGFLMPVAALRVGPVVGLDYARAKVDGYTESGDAALALNVGAQRFRALTGNVGLEARGDFGGGGLALRPFASAMLEKDLEGDSRTATYSQVAAPTIVNRFQIAGRDKGVYTRLSGGASAALGGAISVNAFVSSTLGKDQGNETSAHVGLRAGF
jgi:uncharacterized protein YhjY with autotransporter beta-barrel domain/phospholipase/lecithinase/hemolysin